MGEIYQLTNKMNGKRYIGKTTKTAAFRFTQHVYDAERRNTPLHNAIRYYGSTEFLVETLEKTDELDARERFWIAEKRPEYNCTAGGEGGDTSSSPAYQQARSGFTTRMKGNTYRLGKPNPSNPGRNENIRIARLGKPHPHKGHPVMEETRRRISETLKRRNGSL